MVSVVTIKLFIHTTGMIQVLPIEEYVKAVVASEMPVSFHQEALKAQAIAARTLAVKRMRLFGGSGCCLHPEADICSDRGHCQGWVSVNELKAAWRETFHVNWARVSSAVKATDGLIMTYNGNPIDAVYHNTCGGYTEDSEHVWGNRVSYLRRVECTYCRHSPFWQDEKLFSIGELDRVLGTHEPDSSELDGINIPGIIERIERTPGFRIGRAAVRGRLFEGKELAGALGFNGLRVGWRVDSLVFRVMGSGHGVGMCQYGADGMARQGKTYPDILSFYYTGIELVPMVKPPLEKPLYGKTVAVDAAPHGPEFEMALALKALLEQKGAKFFLSRQEGAPSSLAERVEVVNMSGADIFLSIERNGSTTPAVSGFELFCYPGDDDARHLADLVRHQLAAGSEQYDRGVNEANLYVLRETRMPSVMLRLTLLDKTFYEKVPKAILSGIEQYYRV